MAALKSASVVGKGSQFTVMLPFHLPDRSDLRSDYRFLELHLRRPDKPAKAGLPSFRSNLSTHACGEDSDY